MNLFPRTLTAWSLALAVAFSSGCRREPASAPSEAAPPSTPEKCEHCRAPATPATPSMVETPNTEGHLRSPWLEPAARGSESLLKLRVTDQDGHALDLFDLSARPLALTFLYTRCTNPNRCPLVATQMGRLQKLIEAEG